MNREEQKKITQNITHLKERLKDLDSIIDILIEDDIFTLDDREEIEQVTPRTPQTRFNKFINLLLNSKNDNAYQTFIKALKENYYFKVAEKVQSTSVSGMSHVRPSKNSFDMRRSVTSVGFQVRRNEGSGPLHGSGYMLDMKNMMTQALAKFSENLGTEVVDALEETRARDKEELEDKMDQRFEEFKKNWEAEKNTIIQQNESAIQNLKESVERLRISTEEYRELQEKYEELRLKQKGFREGEIERREKVSQLNIENIKLKTLNVGLQEEVQELKEKVDNLEGDITVAKDNEAQYLLEMEHLKAENDILKRSLEEKEKDCKSLKQEVEKSYGEIRDVVKNQQEQSERSDTSYITALEKQSQTLAEIFEVVNSIKAPPRRNRPTIGGLHIQGNVMERLQRN